MKYLDRRIEKMEKKDPDINEYAGRDMSDFYRIIKSENQSKFYPDGNTKEQAVKDGRS